MTIDKELLDILACPVCKCGIEYKDDKISCPECHRIYPVENNIPVMLIGRATHAI